VYRGDTWAWSEGFDLRGHEAEVDTTKCPLHILAGEYDYVATPAAALETAARIRGAVGVEMQGLGHFPMSENYPRFRPHLLDALAAIREAPRGTGPRADRDSPTGR
jgi:pimeloyl-ACP methyl ester carboxylesterase